MAHMKSETVAALKADSAQGTLSELANFGATPDLQNAAHQLLDCLGLKPEAKKHYTAADVPTLAEQLRSSQNEHMREAAARALGEIGPDAAEAVPQLLSALHDSHSPVQSEAAEALGKLKAVSAIPDLIKALRGEFDEDRMSVHMYRKYSAAQALGDMSDVANAESKKLIIQALADVVKLDEFFVSRGAASALARFGAEARDIGIPTLLGAVKSADIETRRDALAGIGRIGLDVTDLINVVPVLYDRTLNDDYGPNKRLAEKVLADLLTGPDDGIPTECRRILAELKRAV